MGPNNRFAAHPRVPSGLEVSNIRGMPGGGLQPDGCPQLEHLDHIDTLETLNLLNRLNFLTPLTTPEALHALEPMKLLNTLQTLDTHESACLFWEGGDIDNLETHVTLGKLFELLQCL